MDMVINELLMVMASASINLTVVDILGEGLNKSLTILFLLT